MINNIIPPQITPLKSKVNNHTTFEIFRLYIYTYIYYIYTSESVHFTLPKRQMCTHIHNTISDSNIDSFNFFALPI